MVCHEIKIRPTDPKKHQTDWLRVFCFSIASVEAVGVGGCILGLVAAHPATTKLVDFMEGKVSEPRELSVRQGKVGELFVQRVKRDEIIEVSIVFLFPETWCGFKKTTELLVFSRETVAFRSRGRICRWSWVRYDVRFLPTKRPWKPKWTTWKRIWKG